MLAAEVAGDHPAQHDSCFHRQPAQHSIEDRAANIVKVDVDPLGTVLFERRRQVVVFVVDARVEPEVLNNRPALLRAARAVNFSDLAGDAPGGARRGRHHHRVAGLGAADVHHSDVGRGPGRAVHRHDRQLIALAGNGSAEHVVADDHIFLEARQRGDHIADLIGLAS